MTDLAASALAELQLLTASRLVARNHTRLQALESVSCALAGATTADAVLSEVMRAVERTNAGAIWRLEEDESALHTAATTGSESDALVGREPDLARRAARARAGRPGRRGDVPAVPPGRARGLRARARPDVGAVALLPVTAGGHRIGVLGACFHDEQRFTVEDHEYLAALAGISGLALARAG